MEARRPIAAAAWRTPATTALAVRRPASIVCARASSRVTATIRHALLKPLDRTAAGHRHRPRSSLAGVSLRSTRHGWPPRVPAATNGAAPGSYATWQIELITHLSSSDDAKRSLRLELQVVGLDGNELRPVPLCDDNVVHDPPAYPRSGLERDALDRKIVYNVSLPTGLTPAGKMVQIAAVRIRFDAHAQEKGEERIQLVRITMHPRDDADSAVHFTANTCVRPLHDWRLFVRDDAWTDRKLRANAAIAQLEEQELRELRGEGGNASRAKEQPRQPGDRIYKYATYNDLGWDYVLGGGKYKYPRRLATNRHCKMGSEGLLLEDPPDKSGILEPVLGDATGMLGEDLRNLGGKRLASPWVPDDDNFSAAKSAGFVGNALVGALPNVIDQIGRVFDGREFDSLADVVSLYDESLINGVIGDDGDLDGGRPAKNFGKDLKNNVNKRDSVVNLATGRRRDPILGSELVDLALRPILSGVLWPLRNVANGILLRPVIRSILRPILQGLRPAFDGIKGFVLNLASRFTNVDLSSFRSSIKEVSLTDFPLPRSIVLSADEGTSSPRLNTWASDEEFGRMALTGSNPMVITAITDEAALDRLLPRTGPAATAITSDQALCSLLEGRTLEDWAKDAGGKPKHRLFVIDYWAFHGFLDMVNDELAKEANESMPKKEAPDANQKTGPSPGKVMHAGRAVLFRRADGHLVPVAIELAHKQTEAATVYTARDPGTVWLAAKLIFMSIDTAWHQLVSHFVRTHACTEPYLIALRRQLSPTHPVFRLLIPHFKYTLAINAAARSLLINKGGVIGKAFSPGKFSLALSAKVYEATWRFQDEGLAADLKKRGFPTTADELSATVGEYPYAEDGLLIWDALRRYFKDYVEHYYKSDAEVASDGRLQAWWQDVRDLGHGDIKDGWVELVGRDALVEICCTIAWVASAHHAAVNFGQYDYSGWPVAHSSLCRRPAPVRGGEDWQRLALLDAFYGNYEAAAEKELLRYVSPPDVATTVMTTIMLLSAHAEDEQYLSAGASRMDWLPLDQDEGLRAIFDKFQKEMCRIDEVIDKRNQDTSRLARAPAAGGLEYTLLRPTSEKPGVTFRGVPYSISI